LTNEGQVVAIAYIQPGQVFGEEALVGGTTRTLCAETTELSRVQVIGRAQVAAWLDRPELVALARALWTRMAAAEHRIGPLIADKVRQRLADALVYFAQQTGQRTDDGVRLPSRLTHQAIAEYIGSRRETVTQVLGELVQAGLLARDPDRQRTLVI